ncbi:MAG: transglutaminase-like domain-containing protein [Tannerellaceae bacterium]|nr:transglutaminase-like domain-containing protein [Tannerellaceae bacterium]
MKTIRTNYPYLFFVTFLVFILSLILPGCNKKDNNLEYQLLKRYKNEPLKYKAAKFLLDNMGMYYYYEGEQLEKYKILYESLALSKQTPVEITDSIKKMYGAFNPSDLYKKYDKHTLSVDFLSYHIDWAFKVWQEQPWGKNISFDDFCEYILPYRIGDEQPEYWRECLYNQYNPLLDEFRKSTHSDDPVEAARVIIKYLCGQNFSFTTQIPALPRAGATLTTTWKAGTCRELADCVVYICRALGIPCGIDQMIMVGNGNSGHLWNFFLDKKQQTYYCEFPDPEIRLPEEYKIMKCKVQRNTFSINREIEKELRSKKQKPLFLEYPTFIDVTAIYNPEECCSVSLPDNVLYNEVKTGTPVYLCLSSRDQWVIVDWTIKKGKTIRFKDMGGTGVYRIATRTNNGNVMNSDPFLIAGDGVVKFFEPEEQLEEVVLFAKYHILRDSLSIRMRGGVFEGANEPGFQSPDTLHLVTEIPIRLTNTVYTNPPSSYRYVRYKGGTNSFCNVAEVGFFTDINDSIPLKGK